MSGESRLQRAAGSKKVKVPGGGGDGSMPSKTPSGVPMRKLAKRKI